MKRDLEKRPMGKEGKGTTGHFKRGNGTRRLSCMKERPLMYEREAFDV